MNLSQALTNCTNPQHPQRGVWFHVRTVDGVDLYLGEPTPQGWEFHRPALQTAAAYDAALFGGHPPAVVDCLPNGAIIRR
jgi:hypothetical protein